ncbi:hypothetical protein WNY63_05085 [Pseudoalteromonas neustonica]|uniref:SH3 domain-containing protein n=1 Tax=Pseudoalteromonas neustonica TaxID=1840331 RepID=A0ABU9TZ86_9GAMM
MKKLILFIFCNTLLVGCSLNDSTPTPSDLERELSNNLYTGTFQPVQPFTFDEENYSVDLNDDCRPDEISPSKKKTCWLNNLPNSEDYVSITDSKYKNGAQLGNSGVSVEGGKYEIVSQWVRFLNAKPIDGEGNAIEGEDHKVGVGARIVAHISTSEAGINLSDLFAVAAAAENSNANGSLLFTIQGIYGKGVDTYTPKISKLDTENLQRALEAVQSIKTLLHSDDTIQLTAQVVAIRKFEQEEVANVIEGADQSQGVSDKIKKQGWVYVGYFNGSGQPNGPTNLQVKNVSEIKGTLLTRSTLNVRSGYPTFPFYRLYSAIDTVKAGESVEIIRKVETGSEKYWALIEY